MGSCFAENIGALLATYKFKTLINPHGVLYNPLSIATAMERYLDNTVLKNEDLFFANDCYHSKEHHGRFSDVSETDCLKKINTELTLAHHTLKTADWLFITFGSSFIYREKQSGECVGNCHKQPQQLFSKELLRTDEMNSVWQQLIPQLLKYNNKLKIVFTVSPVRYIRDGLTENTLSKARLIELVHTLCKQNTSAFYFPAYELVIDDLRDYRFYKSDLVHPTNEAIEYVFDKLKEAGFNQESFALFEKVKDVITAKNHRMLQQTPAYTQFKTTYLNRCLLLKKEHSFLDLVSELQHFSNSKT